MEPKKNAPYSIASLVLGICSILLGSVFIGLVCGILGLIFANKSEKIMQAEPDTYDGAAMAKAGRICSIIGIVLDAIYIVLIILLAGAILTGFGIGASNALNHY